MLSNRNPSTFIPQESKSGTETEIVSLCPQQNPVPGQSLIHKSLQNQDFPLKNQDLSLKKQDFSSKTRFSLKNQALSLKTRIFPEKPGFPPQNEDYSL